MALSYAYQGFCAQIAYELGYRADLLAPPSGYGLTLSPIQQAVQNAIARWERTRFYFNEITDINDFTTTAGQEFYTSADSAIIGSSPHFDKIWVLIAGNRYALNPRTEQYISDTSLNRIVTGQPIDYAMYAETMRLYPIPDGAYPITFEGTLRLPALANNTDANAWIQDAADLIKAEAKRDIYVNVLKDMQKADAMKKEIHGDPENPEFPGHFYVLQAETSGRVAGNTIRASYF